ncbi:MAG: hypothetical protein ACI87W_002838 [Halieaceae bacterium]|jgi:hypothetical protein
MTDIFSCDAIANTRNPELAIGLTTPIDSGLTPAHMLAALREHKAPLLERMRTHGALLFRGFPIATDMDFHKVIEAFELPNFRYLDSLSNAVRRTRSDRVFTANEAPASVEIFLHHEMAQTPVYPRFLLFFCEKAPTRGGATPLCRSDHLLSAMSRELPDFVRKCAQEGIRYTSVMPAAADASSGQGRGWIGTLGTEDTKEAEKKLDGLGYRWNWLENGDLRVSTPALPAIRRTEDGTRVFFNQLIAAFKGWNDSRNEGGKSVCFGSGESLEPSDLARTSALADALTQDLEWRRGDVVIVDNFLMMHGRRPFEGSRSILASLIAKHQVDPSIHTGIL